MIPVYEVLSNSAGFRAASIRLALRVRALEASLAESLGGWYCLRHGAQLPWFWRPFWRGRR